MLNINKNDNKRKYSNDKLSYPFTLIKQGADAAFIIKQDDENKRLCILSDKPLNIISEEQIMKGLLSNEYFSYLFFLV